MITLAALTGTGVARAEPDLSRTLLDRAMRAHAVQLMSLEDGRVTYTDSGGLLRTEPVSEYIALLPGASTGGTRPGVLVALPPVRADSETVLELTDGQRLAGWLGRAPSADTDSVAWEHPVFGPLTLRLDQVSVLRLKHTDHAAAAHDQDTLVLANGDLLSGFVAAVNGPSRMVKIEIDSAVRDVPIDRLAEVRFANPAQPARGAMFWLADGTIVAADSFRTSRTGEVTLGLRLLGGGVESTEARAGAVRVEDVLAIAFDAASIIPLASIPADRQAPAPGRRWGEPIAVADARAAVLHAPDITLPGPMTVEWAIPPRCSTFGADAELPPDMWTWGDCELSVSLLPGSGAAVELFRSRLSAQEPTARIAVSLGTAGVGRRLRITLDPGRFGAVQDRVVLHGAIFGVSAP